MLGICNDFKFQHHDVISGNIVGMLARHEQTMLEMGGGWANPEGANSMAVSGLGREKPLVGVDRPFLLF